MTLPRLELRILSGMHAGAHLALAQDSYTLGAHGDCDIVLAEEGVHPHHARISWQGEHWQLAWVPQEGSAHATPALIMPPGKAFALGPVIVSISPPEAPWPTLEELVLAAPVPAPELATGPPPAHAAPRGFRWPRGLRRSVVRRASVWTAALATAGVSATALVSWPKGAGTLASDIGHMYAQAGPAQEPASGASAQAQPGSEQSPLAGRPAPRNLAQKQAIEAALSQLGLSATSKVEPEGAGWLVRVVAASDSQAEALSAQLARMLPRPVLRMTTERELIDGVTDMMIRVAPEYRGRVTARHVAGCRFRIEGSVSTQAERDRLMLALAESVPQVCEWTQALNVGEERLLKLASELQSLGDWDIASDLSKGALQMIVKLRPRDVPQWEQALVAAIQSNPVPFSASLEFVNARTTHAPRRENLPFDVVGVVGGAMPYVLLPEGQRLTTGGTWQGWRLASVSGSKVVFENGTRRAVIQR